MAGKIWLVVCLGLIGLELLAPGFFMLWLGVAAGITGLFVLFFGVDILAWQAVLFALTSGFLVHVSIKNKNKLPGGDRRLNNRAMRLVGRTVHVRRVEGSPATVNIDDTLWQLVDDQVGSFQDGDVVRVVAVENGCVRLQSPGASA